MGEQNIFEVPVKPKNQYLVKHLTRPMIKYMASERSGGLPTTQYDQEVIVDAKISYHTDTRMSAFNIGEVLATPSGDAKSETGEPYAVGTRIVYRIGLPFDIMGQQKAELINTWDVVGEWVSPELPVEVDTITPEEQALIDSVVAEETLNVTNTNEI